VFSCECGNVFRGDEIVTADWLRVHAPYHARFLRDAPADKEYSCGTICPQCGKAHDAPGFVEGDDIPFQDTDGTWVCATRDMPPHLVMGHFKCYDEKPLFGRITGTFFWPAHFRGDEKNGKVVKDYIAGKV
jgi:hypothetical protein